MVWHESPVLAVAADTDGNRVDVHIAGIRHLDAKDDWPDSIYIEAHDGEDGPWQQITLDAAHARTIGEALLAAADMLSNGTADDHA